MILDTETFELWMSKIMERFDRHEQMLSKLAGKEIKEVKYLDGEFFERDDFVFKSGSRQSKSHESTRIVG